MKSNRNTTACGTLDYLAPEIVGHKQYQYQVDNWCVGVLAYELLAGRAPFEGTDDETKSKIANISYKFPDYFSQSARRFIDNVRNSYRLIKYLIDLFSSFYKKIRKNVCHLLIVLLIHGYKRMHINICLVLINARFMLTWMNNIYIFFPLCVSVKYIK